MAFNWTCPHCDRPQAVTTERFSRSTSWIGVGDVAEGKLALHRTATGCANPLCRKITVSIKIGQDSGGSEWSVKDSAVIFSERILPRGKGRPQPDYIPQSLREDYYEACLIRDLSPKASATLARRCLQGMIRDFAKIAKSRLIDEVRALQVAVDDGSADRAISSETVAAIDHVRSLGNIGAHMEADIDLIVHVDPGEAQVMIELIELLFDEWYGARERRARKLGDLAKIRFEKDSIRVAEKALAVGIDGPTAPIPTDAELLDSTEPNP